MSMATDQIRQYETIARLTKERCMAIKNYELSERESFAIGFISGVPYRSQFDEETCTVKMTLDDCSINWNDVDQKFMVIIKQERLI